MILFKTNNNLIISPVVKDALQLHLQTTCTQTGRTKHVTKCGMILSARMNIGIMIS